MKITPDELVTLMGRIREEEKYRASSILAEREQALIQRLGQARDTLKQSTKDTVPLGWVDALLTELDPLAPIDPKLKERYPSMFKGGPT